MSWNKIIAKPSEPTEINHDESQNGEDNIFDLVT